MLDILGKAVSAKAKRERFDEPDWRRRLWAQQEHGSCQGEDDRSQDEQGKLSARQYWLNRFRHLQLHCQNCMKLSLADSTKHSGTLVPAAVTDCRVTGHLTARWIISCHFSKIHNHFRNDFTLVMSVAAHDVTDKCVTWVCQRHLAPCL